ncbi:MAG: acyl-CoA dehydrogenase family protein, partial [Rhizobiales bacterium]|nr:acyl-CoA dehydrogenase family protein [Hyphomicrobiales bacterium]
MTLLERYAQNRTWDEQEQMVLDQLQKVAEEVIAPHAAGYDASGEFPHASMDALNAMGLNAIFVPEAYGGAQMSYRLYLECVLIISQA